MHVSNMNTITQSRSQRSSKGTGERAACPKYTHKPKTHFSIILVNSFPPALTTKPEDDTTDDRDDDDDGDADIDEETDEDTTDDGGASCYY
jgi:hypothetical protein